MIETAAASLVERAEAYLAAETSVQQTKLALDVAEREFTRAKERLTASLWRFGGTSDVRCVALAIMHAVSREQDP